MRSSKYFPALDGMRGVAAILALLHHVVIYFSLDSGPLHISFMHDHLYLLVDCFYVMSGFVIAHSFDAKIASGMSFWRFMWFRVLRLYPMIVLGVLFGAVTLIAFWITKPEISGWAISWSIVSGTLLIPTTALLEYKPFAFPVNSPHWSLSFEMILCVAYAMLFARASHRRLLATAFITGVALIGAAYKAGNLDIGFFWQDYWLALGRVFFPFLIGVIIRRSRMFKPETTGLGYLAIPILCLVLWNPIPATWQYDAVCDLVVLPPVVWLIASAKPSKSLDPIASVGGEMSYPLYAIHFPFVIALANMSKILHLGALNNFLLSIACSLFVIGFSLVCYYYFDIPVRRQLAGLFSNKKSDSKPVAVSALS